MDDTLANASIDDLADFLRQRFQMRGPLAADTGTPESEHPYDLPLKLWRAADRTRKRDLAAATGQLIEEIPGEGWTPDAVEWLASFIELAEMIEVGSPLLAALESGRWLSHPTDGPRCHMLALRTLLGIHLTGTPSLWLDLPRVVADRYPELVFRGLLAHDHDMAFGRLPLLIDDPADARRIVRVFSSLVRRRGDQRVREALSAVLPQFPPPVVAELKKWFRVHGWGTLDTPEPAPGDLTYQHLAALGLPEMPGPALAWR